MPSKISRAEWDVMEVLWEKSPQTASEVYAALPPGRWHQKTVNTFLARLAAKRVVRVAKQGNVNLYAAAKARDACIAEEGRGFVQRAFRGAVGPMLVHFCETADLSPEEIRELEQVLKKKKSQL